MAGNRVVFGRGLPPSPRGGVRKQARYPHPIKLSCCKSVLIRACGHALCAQVSCERAYAHSAAMLHGNQGLHVSVEERVEGGVRRLLVVPANVRTWPSLLGMASLLLSDHSVTVVYSLGVGVRRQGDWPCPAY